MNLSNLKIRLVKLACPLGGYQISRLLTRSTPKVLMYHRFSNKEQKGRVPAAIFCKQLAEIRKHFHVMALGDVIRSLRAGAALPPHTVVLTIDDGYRDFYTVAYPLLKDFRLPATVFVTTDFVDHQTWLWPDIVEYALANSRLLPGAVCQSLGIAATASISQDVGWNLIVGYGLSIADDQRRSLLTKLIELSGCGHPPKAIPADYEPMSWKEIREIHANGIEVGGHTRSHPNLASVSSDRLSDEILGCKQRIEQELGERIDTFCYPNGTAADYNNVVRSVVESSGFIGATVAFADNMPLADFYALRRSSSSANMYQFRKALYGVEYCGARVAAWLPRSRQPQAVAKV